MNILIIAELSAPIAKVAYSPANEVSHVYSSIVAPQHAAYVAPQPAAYVAHQPTAYVAHPQPAAYVAHPQPAAYVAHQPAAYVAHPQPAAYVAHQPASYVAHAPVAISTPAIGTSQQQTIRSHGGTISTYSKAVDTAFSSVRKSDTRISNNVYTPALATKTIAYQQPAYIEQKSIPASVVSHVTFDGIGAHYAW